MNVKIRNSLLLQGNLDELGLFPRLEDLSKTQLQFATHFGLDSLPVEPGLLVIRGARQMGKSTWLENELKKSIMTHGAGSAFYLNGDELKDNFDLHDQILALAHMFSKKTYVRRIFIDEITAIPNWEQAIKRLYDKGETRNVLLITTGSKATDLRRGTERLPGRKGRLDRTNYIFTPVSYVDFERICAPIFGESTVIAYILTGGSPIAANELARTGTLPNFIITLTRDWILGECAAQGRSRNMLTWLSHSLCHYGGSPVALAKIARESGVANNTVVQGYIELFADLLCISTCFPIDTNRFVPIRRKPHKYHWTNLLACVAFHPYQIRSIEDFKQLAPSMQGQWLEWLVAQELWRRAALRGEDTPEMQYFWQNNEHEVDFVNKTTAWIEVKRGSASPMEFLWFTKVFPKRKLIVVNAKSFESGSIYGVTLEDFLRHGIPDEQN